MLQASATPDMEQAPASPPLPAPRSRRSLSPREKNISEWVHENYGILSVIARELEVSTQFVHYIAYNNGGRKSAGLRVERALKKHGCPLIQRIA